MEDQDLLVVLQAENGQQITLPVSALPNDFVPGEEGQIIMVGSSLDEQHQEVVVESTTENLTTLQQVLPEQTKDSATHKTYSTMKSYAPTCGMTRIYHQPQSQQTQAPAQPQPQAQQLPQAQEAQTNGQQQQQQQEEQEIKPSLELETSSSSCKVAEETPRTKQKRKEALLLRTLAEEDMNLEFQIIEEQPFSAQESEVKRKPRREYRTKKRVMAMEKMNNTFAEIEPREVKVKKQEMIKPMPQTERRTRLSNTCRVATGKSYRCNDCDYSTDRINNIVLHVKENCPKVKKKS